MNLIAINEYSIPNCHTSTSGRVTLTTWEKMTKIKFKIYDMPSFPHFHNKYCRNL